MWNISEGKSVSRCKIKIPYFDEKNRQYSPDFVVDGDIYEVKAWVCDNILLKLKAAEEQGFKITLVDGEEYVKKVNKRFSTNIEKEYAKFYEK